MWCECETEQDTMLKCWQKVFTFFPMIKKSPNLQLLIITVCYNLKRIITHNMIYFIPYTLIIVTPVFCLLIQWYKKYTNLQEKTTNNNCTTQILLWLLNKLLATTPLSKLHPTTYLHTNVLIFLAQHLLIKSFYIWSYSIKIFITQGLYTRQTTNILWMLWKNTNKFQITNFCY